MTALVARSAGFFPQTRQSKIFEVARQSDGSWGDAVEVPFGDEETSDIDPFYVPDGSRVWFSSIRALDGVARTDVDVWYVDRRPDGSWAEPVNAAEVNSPADDLFPSIGPDGAVYAGSDRGGDGFDIWRAPANADGTWGPATVLSAPVTSAAWEFNPVFAPDGESLVFTAQGREGGEGKGDLFFSRLEGETWTAPTAIAAVNTGSDEYHPAFSADGVTLYFVRQANMLQIAVSATELAD